MSETAANMADVATEITIRAAVAADLRALVELLADDFLGAGREAAAEPLPASYRSALDAILTDPHNEILVACAGERVVACLQLTLTPSLSYRGSWRATIESVRTAAELRSRGIGGALVRAAIGRARARGCGLIQLSTHKARVDALRFYERLGFTATHEGLKLQLSAE